MDHEEQDINNNIFEKLNSFLSNGCGCRDGPKGKSCSFQCSEETITFNLNNVLELSSAELDLVILANIQASKQTNVIGEKRALSHYKFMFKSKTELATQDSSG